MKDNESLAKAIRIVSQEFEGTLDKGGAPYVLHCLAVMDGVKHLGYEVMTAAVLHDLLEDREDWSSARLKEEGFSNQVISMVETLTHKESESYQAYILRVSQNEKTAAVKLADLTHNMNPARLPEVTEKTVERMRKYLDAYHFLTGASEPRKL